MDILHSITAYGALSNYESTIFLRRHPSEHGVLEISPARKREYKGYSSTVAGYVFLMQLAVTESSFHFSPTASRQPRSSSEHSKFQISLEDLPEDAGYPFWPKSDTLEVKATDILSKGRASIILASAVRFKSKFCVEVV